MNDYERIEKAMAYMVAQAAAQPKLEAVAAHVHLSAFHFQRLFCRYVGISPKRFLQALTLERGKQLMQSSASLLDIAHSLGLSGGSRLYDHFVQLDAVTPGEHKSQGQGVEIAYGVHATPLGSVFVAVTPRGICRMGFVDTTSAESLLAQLAKEWPLSTIHHHPDATRYAVEALFDKPGDDSASLSLHVTGTNFQIAVWRALLTIPEGQLASYSHIAQALGTPKSSRAVGNAVGANPIALWIPCHRVIQQSGALGGYRWGLEKKQMVQAWELAKVNNESLSPMATS
ncbi:MULTISPECIES: bifunctional transcriptional activator/DNA repair enzyme AdaA [unclassified Halomonas]|uniref:bifunctional transcriptional activator/DNA repair enzyme AdaA n=1 Tax=unclassified Halomonas TaxID=2609666 RepID=UPI0006DB31D8|nr:MULTISPECIES: methylated-DNA--[protein]-cysteine S-methyltransferase [unclassified Halomonas]KPQ22242.1 MAG: AraC family transcriptional regulator / methylated-DNA-[protein]-cysteine-methyltransferase [Halomonas sp. HL-93]SBR48180.1 AraC family transcriptional regulator, regulatory protein of adaptative response / methylated-DNA-[protein]-cysteine methyltransferase [Halomonas sp. HL-93]SNY95788.1 AraC family transcriptional regulator, regulatory protein of adaptative response / methylated-DNA